MYIYIYIYMFFLLCYLLCLLGKGDGVTKFKSMPEQGQFTIADN